MSDWTAVAAAAERGGWQIRPVGLGAQRLSRPSRELFVAYNRDDSFRHAGMIGEPLITDLDELLRIVREA
jgi:hypothetical protein